MDYKPTWMKTKSAEMAGGQFPRPSRITLEILASMELALSSIIYKLFKEKRRLRPRAFFIFGFVVQY